MGVDLFNYTPKILIGNPQVRIFVDHMQTLTDRKQIVNQLFQLIAQGRMKEGVRFFSPDAKQHNPYTSGSVAALMDGMASAAASERSKHPDADFKVVSVVADGDIVVAQTNLLNSRNKPAQGGLRQAHIFRFKGDKIIEYWDITQTINPEMPNAGNAFWTNRPD